MAKTLTMYDAVDVPSMPASTRLALGYIDGRDTSGHYQRVRARFPDALVVPTTVTGSTLDACVADVERFDITIEHGAQWALEKVRVGEAPTLYVQASNWPALREAVARLKFPPGPPVSYLVADWDGVGKIPRGAVGKQYVTGKWDVSIVSSDWPGVLPTPLSRTSALLARRLSARISRRYTPIAGFPKPLPGGSRANSLIVLHNQLVRVSKLHQP